MKSDHETQNLSPVPHRCVLTNRAGAELTGVREVVAFDENQVILDTDLGLLTIKGKELHVSRLTLEKGELDVEGQVDSLVYSSNEAYRRAGQSWLTRLFG
jgi:sporulation protein YabP